MILKGGLPQNSKFHDIYWTSWCFMGFHEIPWFYVNFMNFHKFLWNCENPSPRPLGHRESAQTMENLRKYIGSGAGNQLGNHQNQPDSSKIMIFAFWWFLLKFRPKWQNLVNLGTFQQNGVLWRPGAEMVVFPKEFQWFWTPHLLGFH